MTYKNPLKRIISASVYSLQGLAYAVKNEQAFRYEAVVLVVIGILLWVMPLTLWQGLFLAGMWLIVMALELVNSAAEKAFDLITQDYHPLVKAGKDMLSASVFVMVSFNVMCWVIVIVSTCIYPAAE
ncbi:MAG: diacylglycerol kinase [Synergistaceae bacterium]|nr:diacylglycerol kinase [Synergistaceae bacterium]